MANFVMTGTCVDCGHNFHLYPVRNQPDNYNGSCANCLCAAQVKVTLVSKTFGPGIKPHSVGMLDMEPEEK